MKFFICCISFIISLPAQPKIPELEQWATDFTSTLTSSRLDDLNYRLKTYEDTTSNQLVVLMISTLNDYPIEYFAIETAEKNKIGTKEHNNGALFLVVKDDHKARIEVGYGLEGVLPDALASSIIRNVMIPHFKEGDYYAGISDGIEAAISAIAGEYKVEPDNDRKKDGPGFIPFIVILIFILSFLFRKGGRRRNGFIFFPGGFGGSSRGGWGGFGGGGFFQAAEDFPEVAAHSAAAAPAEAGKRNGEMECWGNGVLG